MSEDLSEFVDADAGQSGTRDELSLGVERDVFLFQHGDRKYAVGATDVIGVIPWRTPVPLPRSDPRVRGVIQDRGRVVVLLYHPTGEPAADESAEVTRIIICTTKRGYVGLPASVTLNVGAVRFAQEPHAPATVDSDVGALTYLDPTQYVET
jgi:chemotaxis signal transduction protein